MTKHVSPEITGTELTDYIRADDGAIMRWDGIDSFVRFPRLKSAEEVSEDTGPVIPDMTVRKYRSTRDLWDCGRM